MSDLLFGYFVPILCIVLIAYLIGQINGNQHEPYVQYRNLDRTVADVYLYHIPRYRKGSYVPYRFRLVNGRWRYAFDETRRPMSVVAPVILLMGILGGMTSSTKPSVLEFVVLFVMYGLIMAWLFAERPIRAYFVLKKDLSSHTND